MRSLVLCYARSDEPAARAMGEFLAASLAVDISYGECVVGPELDLIEATERALSGDIALVLLSSHSVPKTWRRERWEPVFFGGPAEFGTRIGFVLLNPCKFPELLRRQTFFDCSPGF